jgi:hypothetical protein
VIAEGPCEKLRAQLEAELEVLRGEVAAAENLLLAERQRLEQLRVDAVACAEACLDALVDQAQELGRR